MIHRRTTAGVVWVDGIQRGEVYWANVPTAHSRGSEQCHDQRSPWLIVSADAVHARNPIVLAAPLTTKLDKAQKFREARISLPHDGAWIKGREMREDSLVLTEQVRVMAHERLLEGPVAKLTPTALAVVEAGLAFVLGLPP